MKIQRVGLLKPISARGISGDFFDVETGNKDVELTLLPNGDVMIRKPRLPEIPPVVAGAPNVAYWQPFAADVDVLLAPSVTTPATVDDETVALAKKKAKA